MNNDNIKTWPKVVYGNCELRVKDVPYDEKTSSWDTILFTKSDNVEYIRADIAKEREEKLVRVALEFMWRYNKGGLPMQCLESFYRDAGLEKLK